MSDNILRSYLAKLGFKVDQDQLKKFNESLSAVTKRMAEIGEVAAGASTALVASVTKIASGLERLYYASQRTGSSAANLKSFEYAASQIGLSAEDASGAVEGLARSMRLNPGLTAMLKGLNINPNQDSVKLLLDLIDRLRKMPFYQAARVAQQFGIDDNTLFMMEKNFDVLKKRMEEARKETPINDENVKKFHDFMEQVRQLEMRLENLSIVAGTRLLPIANKLLDWAEQGVHVLQVLDRETDGWSTRLIGVSAALGSAQAALSMFKKLLGIESSKEAGAGFLASVTTGMAAITSITTAAWLTAKRWRIEVEGIKEILAHFGDYIKHPLDTMYRMLTGKGMPSGVVNAVKGLWAPTEDSPEQKQIRDWATGIFGPDFMKNWAGQTNNLMTGSKDVTLNNPGNLRKWGDTPTVNVGHIGKFAKFNSAFEGLSAMAGNLLAYSKHGYNTISSIISRWAPSSENDTQAYIADITKKMGIGANASLDLSDPAIMRNLMMNMIRHEQGTSPYSSKLIDEAISSRTGGGSTIQQKTDIHVHGAGDPHRVGKVVVREQGRVNGDLVRNLQGAHR